jgi:hypothetical protein
MPKMTREPAIAFANQLRSARLAALGDAEAFDGIIHVVERIGSYLSKERLGDLGKDGNLYKYTKEIVDLSANSSMAMEPPDQFRVLLTPFGRLYELVRVARNDALHQGAFARHLTGHAIELAIVLEDALSNYLDPVVTDFMVRNPVCAELWQPVGFIRQQMLAYSYSYLPVFADDEWHVVSDVEIARFLGPDRKGDARRKGLASTLREASIPLINATFVDERTSLDEALERLSRSPVLLVKHPAEPRALLGMLTAFDLL